MEKSSRNYLNFPKSLRHKSKIALKADQVFNYASLQESHRLSVISYFLVEAKGMAIKHLTCTSARMKGGTQALSPPRSPGGRPACLGFIMEAQKLTKKKNPMVITFEAKTSKSICVGFFFKIVTLCHGNYKIINLCKASFSIYISKRLKIAIK